MLDRRFFIAGAASNAITLAANPAEAFISCTLGGNRPLYKGELWDGLASAPWIPLGDQNKSLTVYALTAPWCPFCKLFDKNAEEGNLPFNVRAIPISPVGVADELRIYNLLTRQDSKSWADFHDSRPPRGAQGSTASRRILMRDLIATTSASVETWLKLASPNTFFGTPLLIFREGDAIVTSSGYKRGVSESFVLKNSTPEKIAGSSFDAEMISAIDSAVEFSKVIRFTAESRIRSLPNLSALPIECTTGGDTFEITHRFRYEGNNWGMRRIGSGTYFVVI